MASYARARAIRIAYLIEDGPNAQEALDAIFAYGYATYGGRFSLIVPCVGGAISRDYQRYLSAFDPDVVYSYIAVTQELESSIHESIYPSYLVQHEIRGREGPLTIREFRPQLPFELLSSGSTLPVVCAPRFGIGATRPLLVDEWHSAPDDRVLRDNFGTRVNSEARWAQSRPDDQLAKPFYFLPASARRGNRQDPDPTDECFESVEALLGRMGARGVLTLAQLSGVETRRKVFESRSWSEAFHIFVGDSFVDRIAFWNSRHLYPAWLDGSLVALRFPLIALEAPTFRTALIRMLRTHSNVRSTGGGPASIQVVSGSLPIGELERVRDLMRAEDKFSPYAARAISSLDECVPSEQTTDRAFELEGGLYPVGAGTPWQEMPRSDDGFSVPACAPRHLEAVTTDYRFLRNGFWAVDCDIERSNNLSPYSNVVDRWRLPRRIRIADAFAKMQRSNDNHGLLYLVPRATSAGLLGVYGSYGRSHFTVTEPSDEDAIRTGLVAGKRWVPPRMGDRERPRPEEIAYYASVSDNGRYLIGCLEQFGGFRETCNFLLHPFWRRRFDELGGAVAAEEQSVEAVAAKIRKNTARAGGLDLATESTRRWIAEVSLKAAREEADVYRFLSFGDLKTRFSDYLKEVDAAEATVRVRATKAKAVEADSGEARSASTEPPNALLAIDEPEEPVPAGAALVGTAPADATPAAAVVAEADVGDDEYERDRAQSLVGSLQYLSLRKVMNQGYEWTCRRCLHRNWVGIANLSHLLVCGVCDRKEPPPVDRDWHFRLNEFVQRALRDHGVLPLVWCLHSLQDRKHNEPFVYLGPTRLFYTRASYDRREPDAEIDLLVMSGTELVMVECKSSDRGIDVAQLANVAKRVRPNRLVLAVMAQRTAALAATVERLKEAMNGIPTAVELLTISENDLYARDWLPTGDSEMFRLF